MLQTPKTRQAPIGPPTEASWPWMLYCHTTAVSRAQAEDILGGLKLQDGFVVGHVSCGRFGKDWCIDALFDDLGELGGSNQPLGMVRRRIPPRLLMSPLWKLSNAPNPLPCGCWFSRASWDAVRVRFCPLHAAAKRMYDELDRVRGSIASHQVYDKDLGTRIGAVLAAAKGGV